MTSINLQEFCAGESDLRAYLQAPFRTAEGLVATNGHIMVSIPDDGRNCAPAASEKIARGVSKNLSISRDNWHPLTTKLPPADSCPNPFCRRGLVVCGCDPDGIACPDCDGSGLVECQFCDGTGTNSKQGCRIGDSEVQRRYLALLLDLPGIEVATEGANDPVLFRFDGGRGILMPMKT